MSFISEPMGWILAQLSKLLGHNFAASVLVFTILVNLIMLPLTLKSQKSTAKQARLKHKLDALKKKCGDDRQKYSMAMQELYNKEGVSMSGGCMPMIIRLIIMMGVYYAIVSPFTYVAGIEKSALNAASRWTAYVRVVEGEKESVISDADWVTLGLAEREQDPNVIATAEKYGDHDVTHYAKLSIVREIDTMTDIKSGTVQGAVKEKIAKSVVTREVEVASYISEGNKSYEPIIVDVFRQNGGNIEKLNDISFNLFGIDLRDTPNFSWNFFKNFEANWLIPLASFGAALLTGIISSRLQKKANPEAPNMMAMMIIMPLFSLYIAFGFPCAVGFYWACSSLVSGGIQVITQLVYGPAAINARQQAKGIIAIANKEKNRIANAEKDVAEN